MDPDVVSLAVAVGHRVRALRLGRDWTLDRLAEAAGVSRRMIVNVEHGDVNPSIGILLRIAGALGVALPALVQVVGSTAAAEPTITRAGEGAVLWTSPAGGRGVMVTGTASPGVLELWEWTLAPGDVHESEPHAPGTREAIHVLDGEIVVTVAGRLHRLGVGDAISFSGDVAHGYAHAGSGLARFSLAVVEPGVGASPMREVPYG